ncbi:MAG: hypothetical protein ABIV51_03235, partial [Saprospiraceae bacterium]
AMTIVGNYSPYEVVVHIAKLFNGKIGRLKKVVLTQNKSIRVEADSNAPINSVFLEADGEMLGTLPAVFGIAVRSIQVLDFR